MNVEEIRDYIINKKGVSEGFPFNETTLVFKVAGKMFGLMNIGTPPLSVNLKCDPEKAMELRETYSYVKPGYHMNKVHWNTITISDTISHKLLKQWIDDSYNLVYNKLTKKLRNSIN